MSELLEVKDLSVSFPIAGGFWGGKKGELKAVQSVSFNVKKGEILGLVGESGCGKSTLGKALLRLIEPSAGEIFYEKSPLCGLEGEELRKLRRKMQIIFQDPYSSLNPRMKVGEIICEAFIVHALFPRSEMKKEVLKLLDIVGLRHEAYDKYPHEFSGGQRQRIGIARALAVKPDFIVADEPVSALDVSIQSQILNLLRSLQKEFGLTMLFISHDLNVIRYLCDRVVVMYLGRIMEILDRDQLSNPKLKLHPYTEALLSAAPRKHPRDAKPKIELKGDIPSPAHPPSGCVFHPRCQEAKPHCAQSIPTLESKSQRLISCFER